MKAYCAGPDTNGLIVAICLAFNREEAHFFSQCKMSLLALRDRYCAATECPLLRGIATFPATRSKQRF